MFHALENIPDEQRDLFDEVEQRTLKKWLSLAPFAVIGDTLVGNQEEVSQYPGALAVWMVTIYSTAWHLRTHRVAQSLQGSSGQLDGEALRYAEIHGGIQYHSSVIGQFPDGLRVLSNLADVGIRSELSAGRAWISSTLEGVQVRLALLTEALASPDAPEPDWEQAERSITEMYTELNALQALCRRQGKHDRATTAMTLNALPCTFPVGDEDGSGVVWMSVEESQYGASIVIYKQRPATHPQVYEGMAAVHVDYFSNRVQIQVYDEDVGPCGDTHWGRVQNPYGGREPLVLDLPPSVSDCSIILVQDVEGWKEEPDEQSEQ